MTITLFRAKAADGKVIIWEKPLVGDRMAPYDDPLTHFDKIRFNADFQYLNVTGEDDVSITHTLLAGVDGTGYSLSAGSGSSGSSAPIADGQVRVSTINLYAHGLGYAPLFYVLNNDRIVSPGLVIQNVDDGNRIRMISAFADTTHIRLQEVAISSDLDLASNDQDYKVLVFAEPTADPGKPFLRIKPDEEIVFGWGKISSEQRPIRRAALADADFYVPINRTIDIKNGAIRNISPISGTTDFGIYTGGFSNQESVLVTY